jgi:adenylate kinase
MRLVILGPPGAGKGTQSKLIAEKYGIPAISTGDIFRSNIANGTELGVLVDGLVKSGKYVPDEVTNDLVRNRLQETDCQPGFLLDGYPRTAAQVDELDTMLAEHGTELDVVLELTVDQDEVIDRLIKRSHIEGRDDDSQEVVRHRLDVYTEQTAPLVEVYSKRGLLLQVDGLGEINEVTGRLLKALEDPARNHAARASAPRP